MSHSLSVVRFAESTFHQACAAAGFPVPQTTADCSTFAESCLRGARTKAELYAKVSRMHVTHSQALDQVAQMLTFPQGWFGLTTYAKRFGPMSDEARESDVHAFGLVMAAWVLSDEVVAENGFVGRMVGHLRTLFTNLNEDAESGEFVLRRLFFKAPYSPKKWEGYSAEQVTAIFKMLGWSPAHFVTPVLNRVPVVDGKRMPWPALADVKVASLVDMALANSRADAGFGYRGWEHGVVSMLDSLTDWSRTDRAARQWDMGKPQPQKPEGKDPAEVPSTRLMCRAVFEEQLAAVGNQTVLEVLSAHEASDGFFSLHYQGTPEEVQAALCKMYAMSGSFKTVVFKEPLGPSHQLSVFRTKFSCEDFDAVEACHSAEATLHDAHGAMVAKVGLVLVCVPDDCSLEEFSSLLDMTDDNDVQELALSVVAALEAKRAAPLPWRRLLLVRDWEVRAQDRGQGLGRLLLQAACKKAFKGLPSPTLVAAKVWPLQLVPEAREVVAGVPEVEGPNQRLNDFWQRQVVQAGVRPKAVQATISAGHFPWMQTHDSNMELLAMGDCRRRAARLDARGI